MPKSNDTTKLRLHLNNSTDAFDPKAKIADTEVLSELLDDSSWPRRDPTQTFTHRATGQRPTPGDQEQNEIMDPPYGDLDLYFLTRSCISTYRQGKEGMSREKATSNRSKETISKIVAVASTLFVSLAMTFAFLVHDPSGDVVPTEEPAPAAQPTPTIPPVLPPRGGSQ